QWSMPRAQGVPRRRRLGVDRLARRALGEDWRARPGAGVCRRRTRRPFLERGDEDLRGARRRNCHRSVAGMNYFAFTRPRSIPVTLAMAMTGWLASPAHGLSRLAADVAFLVIVHSVLLWGGTNSFNSAEDRDEGPVNLLPHPPPMPRHLGAFGLVL